MKHLTHIISLPRCRTAWLSLAFMQAPDVYGFHDGCGDHATEKLLSLDDYHLKIQARPEPCIVDCSSGIPSLLDHLALGDGPIIVIEPENTARCRESWLTHLDGHLSAEVLTRSWPFILESFSRAQQVFAHRIALRVPLKQVTEHFPDMWQVACPSAPYDADRIKALARLNVSEII